MIIYRPQRGGLQEAMLEAKEFENEEEMKRYIVKEHSKLFSLPPFDVCDIVINKKAFCDERIGWWDTRYVCVKRYFNEIYDCPQCIGYCATDYRKN